MKTTELMIGDWVQNPLGWKAQVQSIRYVNTIKDEWEWLVKIGINNETFQNNLSLNEIDPIPLTPEILKKIADGGFCDFDSPIIGYKGRRSMGWVGKVGVYVEWERLSGPYVEFQGLGSTSFKGFLKSVHELQHALRVCGFDKEIEL